MQPDLHSEEPDPTAPADEGLLPAWTLDRFLKFERTGPQKHEFIGGKPVRLAARTSRHDRIAGNIYVALHGALRGAGGPCRPHTAEMRIWLAATGQVRYADGLVACPPRFTDEQRDTLTNPCVLVEVVSEWTPSTDRSDRLADYRSLPSLKHQVLVSLREMRVEHFALQPGGSWTKEVLGSEEMLRLTAIDCEISVREFYLWASE